MERKRGVLCCLLVVVLLVGGQQDQVAAESVFCRCYKDCYNKCRSPPTSGKRGGCGFVCFTTCPLVPPGPPKDCAGVCRQLSICGMASADAACVADCTRNHGANALTAANLD